MPNGDLLYRRGEIWWVKFDPSLGVEAKKTRAALILQNDLGNKRSSLTTVAPFLAPKSYPFVVNVQPSTINNLDRQRGIHLNQIRAVDAVRVESKIGVLENDYWNDIQQAIAIQLGFL